MPKSSRPAPPKRPAPTRSSTGGARPVVERTIEGPAGASKPPKDAVAQYLDEIARYPRLTREEEVELSARSLDGDEDARELLVTANLRLVVSICKDFTRNNFPLLDLVSLGNEGLIVAARKYNGALGVPFANYAAYWIKQRVMKYVAENGYTLRMPPYRAVITNQVLRVNARLSQALGRTPLPEEIAREAEVSVEEVTEVLRMQQPALELDAPLTEDNDASTFGTYFGETAAEANERVNATLKQMDLQRVIGDIIATLPPRHAQVVSAYFGINGPRAQDLDHIAARLGVTRERARQLKAEALKMLAEYTDLRQFLE
jgi:RNA polymerase primary sigma factor